VFRWCSLVHWGCDEERFAALALARAKEPVEQGVVTFDCWSERTLSGFGGGHQSTLLTTVDGTTKLPLTFEKADAPLLRALVASGALFARKFTAEAVGVTELLALLEQTV
jgi:hypothetical protein